MFKKIKKNPVKSSIVLIISIATVVAFTILFPFYFIGGIEPGELIMQQTSPTGEYTVKTYLNRAHSTVDYAVLGVLEFNDKNKKDKNIYWQYRIQEGVIEWDDSDTVNINGVMLDVPNEQYDYRNP